MKINKNMFFWMATIGWILNSLGTLIFFWSRANNLVDKIYALGLTLLLEPAMYAFFVIFLYKKIPGGMRTVCFLIWAGLSFSSISATAGYMMNINQVNKFEATKNSVEYKEVETKKTLLQSDIEARKNEIDKLKIDKENTVNNMINDKNSLPRNYTTAKAELQQKINKEVDKLQSVIDKKQTELSDKMNEYSNTSVSNIEIKQSTGYSAYFASLCEVLNSQGADMTQAKLELIFTVIVFGVLPLCIGNLGYYFYNNYEKYFNENKLSPIQRNLPETLRPAEKEAKKEPESTNLIGSDNVTITKTNDFEKRLRDIKKLQLKAPSAKNKIGFETHNEIVRAKSGDKENSILPTNDEIVRAKSGECEGQIDLEDIRIYKEYMIGHAKGNVSPGYKTISAKTGIDEEICRKIKGKFEKDGIVKTQGNRTLILLSGE